jgi:hypothetical protein
MDAGVVDADPARPPRLPADAADVPACAVVEQCNFAAGADRRGHSGAQENAAGARKPRPPHARCRRRGRKPAGRKPTGRR